MTETDRFPGQFVPRTTYDSTLLYRRSYVTSRSICLRTVLTVITLTAILASGLSAQQADELSRPDKLSASDLHRIMGRMKAEALQRSRDLRSAAEAAGIATAVLNYDIKLYDLTIQIDHVGKWVYGDVKFYGEPTESGVTQVDFDLYVNMSLDSIVHSTGLLAFSRAGNIVTVTLDRAYDPGELFEFDVFYNGRPTSSGFQGFSFGTYGGRPMISTLSEPYGAKTWWPCKDRMDDKPDSVFIHIQVDSSLYAASNGTLDSIVSVDSTETYNYSVRYPISTYLVSMAIHPYSLYEQEYVSLDLQDTMPMIHHAYPAWQDTSIAKWGQSPAIMHVLASNYGEYPFINEKYGHANFNWGGGMEHQTCTSMGGSSFGFHIPVVVHEMAHQWWGDMITCESWQDIWLNEGWASYTEALYELETSGWPAYFSYMDTMVYYGNGSIYVPAGDTLNVGRVFSPSLSYDKAAWVVHMLRGVLGETLWQQGIDGYYNSEHKFGAATTEDFIQVWEASTGVELRAFIEDWIYGQYYPKYQFARYTEPSDSGGYDSYVVVRQTQSTFPRTFHMPVDLVFTYVGGLTDTQAANVDRRSKVFKYNHPFTVTNLQLDPAGWILKEALEVPWTMQITTTQADISDGLQFHHYEDTIETRGGGPNFLPSIISGSIPPGLSLDAFGRIYGSPTDAGTFDFTYKFRDVSNGWSDSADYSIYIAPISECCEGRTGDVDMSHDDPSEVSSEDLGELVNYLFSPPGTFMMSCPAEGDVDASGGPSPIDSSDLGSLVNYLFSAPGTVILPDCL